jgi:hypothetical protein
LLTKRQATASHKGQRSTTLFRKKNGVMETGTNPHPMKNTQGASQEAFFVSRGFAKHSMVKPLSTFPRLDTISPAELMLLPGEFSREKLADRRPKKEQIYFFIPIQSFIFVVTN